ncbi:hypothetical protein Mal52_44190 [Symmachiella dynata]|uniref:Sulfatase n=1 Tax=Symmachiella dynata TaxID=2527995 RepID=A0A517ZTW6_9PLAN|nr:DUF1501 domain-containing protein [Symmachiella dynata]QDU45922.1 hypothetical protein Mal52_44190 [Symmachiella dynata]
MDPLEQHITKTRRDFLATSASGLGTLALTSLLQQEGLLAADSTTTDPLAPKAPHFAPKAKNCIFIFMAGAPSQLDLFDPKPKLKELHGKPLPESLTKGVRFAFIKKESAVLIGSKRKFTPHGECGMELSDVLPNIGTCADDIALIRSMRSTQFNHHPGQLLMTSGVPRFGFPSVGSWLNYGLGTASRDLPGYVVLTSGRGASGGATNWTSGFLPSTYQGVLFRNKGEPVLNLNNPAGVSTQMQKTGLEALSNLNQSRYERIQDPEIASRIASYELAYRMQTAAPELIDLSGETQATLDAYGVGRTEEGMKMGRGGGKGTYNSFSTNCLLARRLIERGVRFTNIIHASWDHHSSLDTEIEFNAKMADQPVAALIKDLKERGLLDETLVVWGCEFGRTPLGENRGGSRDSNTGRDHHPFAFSMFMAGGGIKGGQVIGRTDDVGWNIEEDPVEVNDLHATLLHLFGINHLKLTVRFGGRDVRLTDVAGNVVQKLLA